MLMFMSQVNACFHNYLQVLSISQQFAHSARQVVFLALTSGERTPLTPGMSLFSFVCRGRGFRWENGPAFSFQDSAGFQRGGPLVRSIQSANCRPNPRTQSALLS